MHTHFGKFDDKHLWFVLLVHISLFKAVLYKADFPFQTLCVKEKKLAFSCNPESIP